MCGIEGIVDDGVDGAGVFEAERRHLVAVEKNSINIEFDAVNAVAADGVLRNIGSVDAKIAGTTYLDFRSDFWIKIHVDRVRVEGIDLDAADGGSDWVGEFHTRAERIDGFVGGGDADFVVEMRTTRRAGVSGVSHDLSLRDGEEAFGDVLVEGVALMLILIVAHPTGDVTCEIIEVHVDRLVTIGMGNVEHFSSTPWRDIDSGYIAGSSGTDGSSDNTSDAEV